jgi:small subunit ribosomal protein S6
MHDYELMYILHPRLTVDEANGAIERVNAAIAERSGELIAIDNWGRRRLAYPINHHFEGTYVLTTLRLPPTEAAQLETGLRISEEVIRHLLVRGIIPYEGPPTQDERSRAQRPMASDTSEFGEDTSDDDADRGVDELDAGMPSAADDEDDESESGPVAEGSRATETAG